MSADYCVVVYQGREKSVVSGMGRHKGTQDFAHSRRTAQRHAKALRANPPAWMRRDAELKVLPV